MRDSHRPLRNSLACLAVVLFILLSLGSVAPASTSGLSSSNNHPDAPTAMIRLSGQSSAALDVGTEPASLGATLFTGGTEDQNLRLVNAGDSPLGFTLSVVPRLPEGVTCVPTRAFATDVYGGRLLSVDLEDGTWTVVASGLSLPIGVAVSPDKAVAYVTQYGRHELSSVNLATGSVNRVAGVSYPEGVALDSIGVHAFVTGYFGSLSSVDLATGTVQTITTGLTTPIGVALNGPGTEAIVAELYGNRLSSVNLSTGSITTIVSGMQGPNGLAIDSTGTTAFVSEVYSGRVLGVTLASGAVRTVTSGLLDPYAVALDPAGVTAYVSEYYDYLTAVDLATGTKRQFASGLGQILGIALNTGVSCQPVFMSLTPSSGSVPASGFLDITAHFDAHGLPGGTYLNDILVTGSGAPTPILTIPATLTVIGAPDIEVQPSSLDFPATFVGYGSDLTLVVRNVGTEPLHISGLQLEGEFSQAGLTPPVIIPVGESRTITVTYSPSVPGPASGQLILNSDDPYVPAMAVPLTGSALDPPIVGVAPSSLQTTLLTGGQETQTLTLTNSGGSDLAFALEVRPAVPGPLPETQVVPAEFQSLASSPVPLTCVVEDPGARMLYAQAFNGTAFYRYRATSDVWEPLAASPLTSGDSGGAALLNGKIYTAYLGNGSLLGVYDISSNSWSTIHNPLGYGTTEIASDGNRYLYLLIYTYLVRLDPVSGVVTTLPNALYSFSGHGVLRHLDGKLYTGPGGGGAALIQFDIASNRWTDLGLMPGGSWIGSAIDPLARDYFTAGWGIDGFNNFFRYSIDSATWSVSEIPTFQVGDGGMGWLPGPVPGIYFVQGRDGTGFARMLTLAPFLSLSPTTGTVPAGGTATIQAQFDAVGIPGGVYHARIDLTSNDPAHPLVSVPAQLSVIGIPDIEVEPASLAFPQTFTGQSSSLSLTLLNRGTDTLHISGVRLEGEFGQTGLEPPTTLTMGERRVVTVAYSPTVPGSASGRLILDSDDPDEPELEVPLSGTALLPPVVGVTPASLSAALYPGASEIQTLTIANTGGSDLTFSLNTQPVIGGGVSTEQALPGEYERLAPSPTSLTCVVEDSANQVLYGQAESGTAFYRYRADTDTWETLASSPVRERACTAALLNGKIYTNGLYSSLIGVYDIASNTWSTLLSPFGLSWGGIASDGTQYLYLTQGFALARLDTVSGAVLFLASPPFGFTIGSGLRYLDGKLYGHQGNIYRGFAQYDIAANAWTPLPQAPGGAILGSAIDPLSKAYFTYDEFPSATLYRFSIETGSWSSSAIPFFMFSLGDAGGMGWLPGPVPGIYFTEGTATGFARFITGVPLLTADPLSGTVPPGGHAQIQVKFDAGILPAGTYHSDIQILSNDPVNSLVTVPATLQVYGDIDHDGLPDPFDNCQAVANPDQADADADAVGDACDTCTDPDQDGTGNPGLSANTCPIDNCPSTANPDQLDTNNDGSGDACQPSLALSSIQQDGGSALEVRALAHDPQGDALSGTIRIFVEGPTTVVLQDAFATNQCQAGLPLGGANGTGIAFANASIGRPLLFDMDFLLGCADFQPDYEIAKGLCSAPTSAFNLALDLSNLPLPSPICVHTTSIPRSTLGFTVTALDANSITLQPSSAPPPLLTYPFTGWPPQGDSIASLAPGANYRLQIVLSDGNTVPVNAAGTFLYQGESILLFNNPPEAHAVSSTGPVECDRPGGGPVSLNASSSTDPDSSPGTHDDIVQFDWILDVGQPSESPLGSGEELEAIIPLGAHTVTLRATDTAGESDSTSIPVSVVDTVPPLLTVTGNPTQLWPPNHRLVPITVSWQATDLCTATPSVRLISAASNEPDDAPGDADGGTTGDISGADLGTPDTEVSLRAERSSAGSGRTYELKYECADAAGNLSTGSVLVQVPLVKH